jgi:predicted nucleic acid-binding protein
LSIYLDASVLVSMFTIDEHTTRARGWLGAVDRALSLSDWTLTEFSSATAIGVRVGRFTEADRDEAEARLGAWLGSSEVVESVDPDDVRMARGLIRATRLPLRASDALHLAITHRLGDTLATFDVGMARAAADLGIAVEDL